MLLGTRSFTVGNTTIYSVDYNAWLAEGASLASGTATLATAGVSDIVISQVRVTQSKKLLFTIAGGSLNEIFTIALQVTDSRGEVKNDTVAFRCVAP